MYIRVLWRKHTCLFGAYSHSPPFLLRNTQLRDCTSGRGTTSLHTVSPAIQRVRLYTQQQDVACLFKRRAPSIGSSVSLCGTYIPQRGARLPSVITLKLFHTSGSLKALPAPFIWILLKPLQKFTAIILGRSIRKWWLSLPPDRWQLLRQEVWRRRWQLVACAAGLLLVFTVFLVTHLDECPITGRTRLVVISQEDFTDLTNIASQGLVKEFEGSFISANDPRHKAVGTLVEHLAHRNQDVPGMSNMSLTVHVVDNPEVNAFVLANGNIFVFTGMLDAVKDVHQLSFVLCHEMAHALIGHSLEQVSLSHVVDFLSLIVLTAVWAICPRDSLAVLAQWIQSKLIKFLFDRPFSRKLEAEADRVGLHLAAKACADVRAGPVFWQQMEVSDKLLGMPAVPEWLSTHPSHNSRAHQLNRMVPEALELRANCDCPALPQKDPRVIFSETMQQLLEQVAKEEEKHKKGTSPMPSLPQTQVVGAAGSVTHKQVCKVM